MFVSAYAVLFYTRGAIDAFNVRSMSIIYSRIFSTDIAENQRTHVGRLKRSIGINCLMTALIRNYWPVGAQSGANMHGNNGPRSGGRGVMQVDG